MYILLYCGYIIIPPPPLSGPTLPQEDRDEDNDSPAPGPSHGRAPPPPPPHIKKTARQIEGERVLSLLVSEGVGSSFSFPEAMNISSFIRKTAKKQTTRFSGVLEIGPQLKIPCKIFTKVRTCMTRAHRITKLRFTN